MPHDLFGHTTHDKMGKALTTMRTHYDHIRLPFFCYFVDRFAGFTHFNKTPDRNIFKDPVNDTLLRSVVIVVDHILDLFWRSIVIVDRQQRVNDADQTYCRMELVGELKPVQSDHFRARRIVDSDQNSVKFHFIDD
ncbi:hypothetical protein [Mucilaginibacter sp.]|uniref:hypothetical protein n=1 Tax=Mucilaginibacter sp. TaxID=1882438 RepID=UPI0032638345